ncbi:NAD(P)-dependent oxidoreductase [Rubellicoccus peritrichatus]|uniref:NAD(P)-dependent oxidoreductase n=1 Tax=Rubellicoccus peritrichatus TaxID=3080537 RepID=A0AAQ3QY31_9BACT|nr:NAD(P)-dependent oxidoreductase [Puniceicoccus sp. CR14]WOO43410.1 NAD(P)-dependent oxidoreductase [Puniceicoccus sp. CR14]
MRILFTGSAGFLGQSIFKAFEGRHKIRLMDVRPFETDHEMFIGDVGNLDDCRRAVKDIDTLVIAHMAPRPIDRPEPSFDAAVKGTANLFFAAEEAGIKRICLISSVNTVRAHGESVFASHDTPMQGIDIYDLSKICQEVIAEQYHRCADMKIAVLRIGYVVDAKLLTNKYGVDLDGFVEGMIDRGDVGEAALRTLELPDLGYEIFYVIGELESKQYEVTSTWKRLGWIPKHLVRSVLEETAS